MRVLWAVAVVLGFFLAWFVPEVMLAGVVVLGMVALRSSRRAFARADGRMRWSAAWPPIALLALLAAVALVPWDRWFAAYEAQGPNPSRVPAWSMSPVEHLVYADPSYAGVIEPVLCVAVPSALAIALVFALARRDG